jgi:hypothetical protein
MISMPFADAFVSGSLSALASGTALRVAHAIPAVLVTRAESVRAAIADEVENFRNFALGKGKDARLRLDTLQGIWSEFDKIASAPSPNPVDATVAQFGNWITQAVTASGLAQPSGATRNADQILRGLIKHESKSKASPNGTHAYMPTAPLAFSSVQVGTQTNGAGANLHQLTDWGLGFAKVQPPASPNWSFRARHPHARSYVLDLTPGNSFVERLLAAGFDVYLLDWGTPDERDAANRLEDYVDAAIPAAIEQRIFGITAAVIVVVMLRSIDRMVRTAR